MKLPLQAAYYHSTFQRLDLEENSLTSLLISITNIAELIERQRVDEHLSKASEQIPILSEF
jgi:hypothetical protein